MSILYLFILIIVSPVLSQECCSLATGSCRHACEEISLVRLASETSKLRNHLVEVDKYCVPQLTEFWECMNETIQDIVRGGNWSGRYCCHLPQSEKCQLACVKAESRTDLGYSCRQSDEMDFYSCLQRQEIGDECCAHAHSSECRTACSAIFRTDKTPTRAARDTVTYSCAENSPRVLQCVKNQTRVTPAHNSDKYLHCCEKAKENSCRETCKRTLRTKTTTQEIVDSLQDGGCGPPLPHEKIWQCFLQGTGPSNNLNNREPSADVSRIDRMGIDSAKLQCCGKAMTNSCRKQCLKTFSNEWTRLHEAFDRDCLSQINEERLVHCLSEVEEPCELGCEGLNYCTNFNNRPTELFRSCTPEADEAARYDYTLWQQKGSIQLPGILLPVYNISECAPLAWKTIACTLQTRPCHSETHTSRICREDCFDILNKCMDTERLPPGITAATICARLSPDASQHPHASCISLKHFMKPSPWKVDKESMKASEQVTAPCRGDPCNESEVCTINRNCPAGKVCPPYKCSAGCKLGEISEYVVPQNTYIRIPLPAGPKSCLKVCQCSAKGTFENCKQLQCFPLDSCWLGGRKIAEHGAWFYIECNLCSCYAGEITCSKRQCEIANSGGIMFSSLPCNCPPHRVPVCGRNGNTYPSSCLAKCAGLKDADIEYTPCSSKDPCTPNPCGEGQKCVPNRQVCLSLLHKQCLQFQCVDVQIPCTHATHDPVCDTNNQEHPNLCYLARYGKRLAYKGKCLHNCDPNELVCGIDGQTYLSECSALANRIAVDYTGRCVALGLIGNLAEPQCAEVIKCPPLAVPGCISSTPPGACCPVCGGAIRLLYSQKQIDRILFSVRDMRSMSVQSILNSLNRHIQVAECALYGYLTVELDIYVLIKSNVRNSPSNLQLAACVGEAEKLASLIQRESPRLFSELPLSVLTAAAISHVASSASITFFISTVMIALIPIVHFYIR